MKILIVYATTDGQTRKIARFCADHCADVGHTAELLSASDADGTEVARFDGVILAGSLHLGSFQQDLIRFASRNLADMKTRPSLFLPVSLSAAGTDAEDWAGLTKCVVAFEAETGWDPSVTEHVAGAFKFSEYDFFKSLAMRWIAHQKGEAMGPDGDREYTDWAKLTAALDGWLQLCASARRQSD